MSSSAVRLRSLRFAMPAALAVVLSSLTGCTSGINTLRAPVTPTRMNHIGAFPIEDPAPGSRVPMLGRGYGFMGG